jgi:hypothetical protein
MDMAKTSQPAVASTAYENGKDSEEILEDQDQTNFEDKLTRDENMGAKSYTLDTLEDEPADFARGEVDVKAQMDRAERKHDNAIFGYESLDDEGGPEGGLEEVIEKTEQALSRARHPRH